MLRALSGRWCKYCQVILGILNMNILYKYCDQEGFIKVLESLELKLPYISEVNDPLECKPYIDKYGGITAMEEQCFRSFRRNSKEPSDNWRQILQNKYQTGEGAKLQKKIAGYIDDMKNNSCLLSVSKEARSSIRIIYGRRSKTERKINKKLR